MYTSKYIDVPREPPSDYALVLVHGRNSYTSYEKNIYNGARGKNSFFCWLWCVSIPKCHTIATPSLASSLRRRRLQFHWWSYDVPYYLDALNHLQDMKGEGKIRHVGLTNFDTKRLEIITDKGIQIASNQVLARNNAINTAV